MGRISSSYNHGFKVLALDFVNRYFTQTIDILKTLM